VPAANTTLNLNQSTDMSSDAQIGRPRLIIAPQKFSTEIQMQHMLLQWRFWSWTRKRGDVDTTISRREPADLPECPTSIPQHLMCFKCCPRNKKGVVDPDTVKYIPGERCTLF